MENKHKNIMSGDHPSFTKSKLNLKDESITVVGKKSTCRISPTISNIEKETSSSETAITTPDNKELIHAAMGSLRWPPYLLLVWIFLLVVTHLLHCTLSVISFILPHVKVACQLSREWSAASLKRNVRVCNILSVFVCVVIYSVYCVLYCLHHALLWSIQPLTMTVTMRDTDAEEYYDE